jgi:hypothetical protein
MTTPSFLIIGAQKCGTTWLSHRLRQHPEIFTASNIFFFDNPANYARGIAWYAEHFKDARGARAIGDKTPSYIWGSRYEPHDPGAVARRARQTLPDARLVVTLRNPVARAISQFNFAIQAGKMSPLTSIDEVLTGRSRIGPGENILDRGRYARQLERWLEYFPRERLRVLLLERDIADRPAETLTDLCNFLGVDSTFAFQEVHESERRGLSKAEIVLKYYARPLQKLLKPVFSMLPKGRYAPSAETLKFLTEYYAPENERLARLLDIDLSCWQKRPPGGAQSKHAA